MLKKIWDHLEELVGSIMVFVMVSVAFVNVVVRYLTSYSFSFTEELEVNLFVWCVMFGTSMAFKQGANLSLTMFYELCPKSVRKLFFILSTIATLAFFCVLGYMGYLEVLDEIALGVTTESLAIPVYFYTIATPLVSALIVIRILEAAMATLRKNEY